MLYYKLNVDFPFMLTGMILSAATVRDFDHGVGCYPFKD